MSPDTLSVTVRALALIALFQAVGAVFFMSLFAPHMTAARAAVRRVIIVVAAYAALLALVHHGLEAARMAGDYSGLWDPELQKLAWWSRSVLAVAVQVVGLLIVMLSLWLLPAISAAAWLPRKALPCASAGGAMALCALLLTGHTSAHTARAVLAPLLGLHLLVIAFWYGALWPLLMVIRLEAGPVAARLVSRYSTIAGYLVPLIAVAGVAMAWLLTGEWPGMWTALHLPYGQLLLLKLLLFMLLMIPAAYNRWWLVPALGRRGNRHRTAA